MERVTSVVTLSNTPGNPGDCQAEGTHDVRTPRGLERTDVGIPTSVAAGVVRSVLTTVLRIRRTGPRRAPSVKERRASSGEGSNLLRGRGDEGAQVALHRRAVLRRPLALAAQPGVDGTTHARTRPGCPSRRCVTAHSGQTRGAPVPARVRGDGTAPSGRRMRKSTGSELVPTECGSGAPHKHLRGLSQSRLMWMGFSLLTSTATGE